MLSTIPVRAPFPWTELLGYLSVRSIPVIEAISPDCYRRRLNDGIVSVAFDTRKACLRIDVEGVRNKEGILDAVAKLFDTDFDSSRVVEVLGRTRLIGPRIRKVPGLRPLGAWDPFELCVRTILGQQVTVAAAATLMQRWVQRCGAITPECVLAANLDNIGMPSRRVDTVRTLARALLEKQVLFDAPWTEIDAALKALPGFGPWTRDYLAIRLGRDSDAFPASDLGLIRAAKVASPAQLLKIAERWRPYRAYAATYLWAVDVK